jgi:hypothetical protein
LSGAVGFCIDEHRLCRRNALERNVDQLDEVFAERIEIGVNRSYGCHRAISDCSVRMITNAKEASNIRYFGEENGAMLIDRSFCSRPPSECGMLMKGGIVCRSLPFWRCRSCYRTACSTHVHHDMSGTVCLYCNHAVRQFRRRIRSAVGATCLQTAEQRRPIEMCPGKASSSKHREHRSLGLVSRHVNFR